MNVSNRCRPLGKVLAGLIAGLLLAGAVFAVPAQKGELPESDRAGDIDSRDTT